MKTPKTSLPLNLVVGYMPGVAVRAEDARDYSSRVLAALDGTPFVPFAGLILGFHEVVFASPEGVHHFLRRHYTASLRRATVTCPLTVRAFPISGRTILQQLGHRGLIVDAPVRCRLEHLLLALPWNPQPMAREHLLEKTWLFYTLSFENRRKLAGYLRANAEEEAKAAVPVFSR